MKQKHEVSGAQAVCCDEIQQPWLRPLAKGLGRAARLVSEGFERVTSPPAPRRGLSPVTARVLSPLVRQLGGLVAAHAHSEYASLIDEPEFWALVGRINELQHRPDASPVPPQAASEMPAVQPAPRPPMEAVIASEADAPMESEADALKEEQPHKPLKTAKGGKKTKETTAE